MRTELWLGAALVLLPALAVGAYRLGLRDGLWQAGRTLPGLVPTRKKAAGPAKKPLAARVEDF